MRVFKAISLLAAASAALFVSARPLSPRDAEVSTPVRPAGITGIVDGVTGTVLDNGATGGMTGLITGLTGGVTDGSTVRRADVDEDHSLPRLILIATSDIAAISAKIHTAATAGVDVDVDAVVGLVKEISVVIARLAVSVKGLIRVKGVLALGGKAITVVQLGHLVARLLHVVVSILFFAKFAIGSAKVTLIAPLLAQISVDLGLLLGYMVKIAGTGVIVQIAGLMGGIVATLKALHLTQVIAVLKL